MPYEMDFIYRPELAGDESRVRCSLCAMNRPPWVAVDTATWGRLVIPI